MRLAERYSFALKHVSHSATQLWLTVSASI